MSLVSIIDAGTHVETDRALTHLQFQSLSKYERLSRPEARTFLQACSYFTHLAPSSLLLQWILAHMHASFWESVSPGLDLGPRWEVEYDLQVSISSVYFLIPFYCDYWRHIMANQQKGQNGDNSGLTHNCSIKNRVVDCLLINVTLLPFTPSLLPNLTLRNPGNFRFCYLRYNSHVGNNAFILYGRLAS